MCRNSIVFILFVLSLAAAGNAQICGDCNMDGQISILDALLIAQMASGLISPTPADFLVCDVDADGDIDILDSLKVAQVAAGLPVVLTCPSQDPPICAINSPTASSPIQTGNVDIGFISADPDSPTLNCTFEYSTNGGATWSLASVAVTSPAPYTVNPTPAAPPGVSQVFVWDSNADIAGTANIEFRLTVSDGTSTNTCVTDFVVDNSGGATPPSCSITAPIPSSPIQSGDVDIVFDSVDPDTVTLQVTFEWSTNGGALWNLATVAATSPPPYTVNPTPVAPPGTGWTFRWNSAADITGMFTVDFRVTVFDGTTSSACTTDFTVDNVAMAVPPTCTITAPVASIESGDVEIEFNTVDPDTATLLVTFEWSTNGGVIWNFATVAATSPAPYTVNPTPAAPPGTGLTFEWDSATDISGMSSVEFRMTVFDGTTASMCFTDFVVDNGVMTVAPTCAITAPVASIESGDVDIEFNTVDPDTATLLVTFEWSTNGGVIWNFASVAATSPAPYTVNPTPVAPPGAGLTFVWDSATDISGMSSVEFRMTVFDGTTASMCFTDFVVDNGVMTVAPTCAITAPVASIESGDVDIEFNTVDPDTATLLVTFEWSTNGGVIWNLASVAATSPAPYTANPTPAAPPGTGLTFVWDSATDISGMSSVEFRMTVFDGTTASMCFTDFTVDNGVMAVAPTCTITAPVASIQSGDIDIEFNTVDPDTATLLVTFEWSTNGGASWNIASVAATSPAPYTVNPTPAAPPGTGLTFGWDSAADLTGMFPVEFRMTVFDGTTASMCFTDFVVDNGVMAVAPTCTITAPVASIQSGDVDIEFNTVDPDTAALQVTFEWTTNGGALWNLATVAATSPVPYTVNPTPAAPPGTGLTFGWDSAADITGTLPVEFRITVFDGTTASMCFTDFVVDNGVMAAPPSCTITAPMGSIQSGDVDIVFTTVDPDSPALQVTFEWSTNGGVLWNTATVAATSPAPYTVNPTPAAPPGVGLTFVWDSASDVTGTLPIEFRVTVFDGTTSSTCFTDFVIDNGVMAAPPSCTITAPISSIQSGDVDIVFTTVDPDTVTLQVTFEWSTNSGALWNLATVAATSPVPYTVNPTPVAPPGTGLTFVWDSASDVTGTLPVEFRITVFDGTTSSTCLTDFVVDNGVMAAPPSCMITAPSGSGPAQSGDVDIDFDSVDVNSPTLECTFDYTTDGGATWQLASVAAASPAPYTVNPTLVAPSAPGQRFTWDSGADIMGPATFVLFRVQVFDGTTSSICETGFLLDNSIPVGMPPSCSVTGPLAGGPTQVGDVNILFDSADPDSPSIAVTFEYSTDGGTTYDLATVAAASPAPYVVNPTPTAPPAAGQTFIWNSVPDVPGVSFVLFRVTVFDGVTPSECLGGFTVDNSIGAGTPPVCQLLSPAGTLEMGDVDIVFTSIDPDSAMLDVTFEYSTDGGFSFTLASVAAASMAPYTTNPTIGAPPGPVQAFTWDSLADLPGLIGLIFRVTVFDGTSINTCSTAFTLDNSGGGLPAPPTCLLIAPVGGTLMGPLPIEFSTADPDSPTVDVTFEVSIDGGVSYFLATPDITSPVPYTMNPALGVPTGLAQTFIWDSVADVPGIALVTFRITVSDGTTPTICITNFAVDNFGGGGMPPSCMITNPLGGSHTGAIPVVFSTVDPDTAILNVTLEFSTDMGITWQLATPHGTSPPPYDTNPATLATTGLGAFVWDSGADIMGMSFVTFRITVFDGLTASSCMSGFTVNNGGGGGVQPPSCNIFSPRFGTFWNDIAIDFTTADPDSPTVDVSFAYSTDGGSTFQAATVDMTSPFPYDTNPAMSVAPGGGVFVWDSAADIPGMATVIFLVTVQDGVSAQTCSEDFVVNNNMPVVPNPGDLIISEIMKDPSAVSDASGEWFELRNVSGSNLDLDGSVILDAGVDMHTITNGGPLVLTPGSYMVLGNNADSMTNGGVTVAYQYMGITLSNADDEVILQNRFFTELARVEYDDGVVWPDPVGASLNLDPSILTVFGGTQPGNWCAATMAWAGADLGSPAVVNDSCSQLPLPADIIITEIHADPDPALGDANGDGMVSSSQDEFVELVNVSNSVLDLSGCVLRDVTLTIRHTFPMGTSLPIGRAIVVFGGGTAVGSFGGNQTQIASTGTLALDDTGDSLILEDALAITIDSYTFGAEGGMSESIMNNPEPTVGSLPSAGRPMVLHSTVNPLLLYSAGTKADGTTGTW